MHERIRRYLLSQYHPSAPCCYCRLPLGDDVSQIHLAHTDDRLGYRGLAHAKCNEGNRAAYFLNRDAVRTPLPTRLEN